MSAEPQINAGTNNPALQNSVVEEEVHIVEEEGDEEEEEIIEEEVSEYEEEEEDVASDAQSSAVAVESPPPAPKKPAASKKNVKASKTVPGKVSPSEEVKSMKMKSPDSTSKGVASAPRSGAKMLDPEKNPFPAFGDWTPETLGQIEISFPILTGKNETTNELTRSTKPEARYWKAPITFKFGNYVSETLRINNVHIPHHTGKGYGSSYVYLCLPKFMGDAFAEAGKRRAPTKVGENSLVPDAVRWWKIANNVENVFGIVSGGKFSNKSLETIFDSTNAGISCSLVLSFKCKAATTEKEQLRPTTVRTVAIEVIRGYINEVDVNVQMPTRVTREKAKIQPVANTSDVATDSLMKRLADLGL